MTGHAMQRPDGLADVLERILDKGVVIAGDVQVSLVGIELLSIRLRLIVATVDKAREMGIDWWERDPALSGQGQALQDQCRCQDKDEGAGNATSQTQHSEGPNSIHDSHRGRRDGACRQRRNEPGPPPARQAGERRAKCTHQIAEIVR